MERVSIKAIGYEWTCPNPKCDGHENQEPFYTDEVTCEFCGKTYETEPPEHKVEFV